MSSIPSPAFVKPSSQAAARPFGWVVYGLLAAAIGLIVHSLREPWWFFRLYAPQYPRGLTLIISLKGLSGDVREIDMLNHYIGMAHLDEAAAFERQYAQYGVALLVVGLILVAVFTKPARSWLLAALGALFPIGFLSDSLFWLYRFGHSLDTTAPLRIPAFTPQLFGNGNIGQFMTFARPERGFWLVVLAVVLLGVAAFVRARFASSGKEARP